MDFKGKGFVTVGYSTGSGQSQVAGCSKHDIEPSTSINGGEFFDQLSDYQLLMENYALCEDGYFWMLRRVV
jgi:hypothetical protein